MSGKWQFSLAAMLCVMTAICMLVALWRVTAPWPSPINALIVVGLMLIANLSLGLVIPRRCRGWSIAGAVITGASELCLYLLRATGVPVWRVPLLRSLLSPGDMITWLFILGDAGGEAERTILTILTGTLFYAFLGALVAGTISALVMMAASTRLA